MTKSPSTGALRAQSPVHCSVTKVTTLCARDLEQCTFVILDFTISDVRFSDLCYRHTNNQTKRGQSTLYAGRIVLTRTLESPRGIPLAVMERRSVPAGLCKTTSLEKRVFGSKRSPQKTRSKKSSARN